VSLLSTLEHISGINDLYDIAEVIARIEQFTSEQLAFIAVFYGVHAFAAIFTLRTITVFTSRKLGLYHPTQYHRWPRLPWRVPFKAYIAMKMWKERLFTFGHRSSGGFASVLSNLTMLYKPGMVLLGRAYAWGFALMQPIGCRVTRHLFMISMSGGGKTSALITILSCWRGSAFIIDPKATITNCLHERDKRKWYVFDLSNISTANSISINFIDVLKEAMEREGRDAAVTPSGARSPYFYDISRGFVVGLILHILTTHNEEDHNLPYMRDLIMLGYRVFCEKTGEEETTDKEALAILLRAMRNNSEFDGVISGAAVAVANAGGETSGNVWSTLQQKTFFLSIPAVRERLLTSSISLSVLKTRNDCVLSITATVFSVREELSDLIRLTVNMVSYVFEAVKEKNGQCLTIVDELPSLGNNPIFEVLLPVARSYGQTFLGIAQDVEILKKSYPQSWEGFLGNADCIYWMASNHESTTQYLSKILGKTSIVEKDRYSGRKFYRDVEVMSSDQTGRFLEADSQRIIVTRAGKRALALINDPYFKALPVWAYAPDPDYGDSFLRGLTRALVTPKPKTIEPPTIPSPELTPTLKEEQDYEENT